MGDVVQLRHPVVEGEGVVKRVVGLGGDYVVLPGGEGAGGGGEGELMVQVSVGSLILDERVKIKATNESWGTGARRSLLGAW